MALEIGRDCWRLILENLKQRDVLTFRLISKDFEHLFWTSWIPKHYLKLKTYTPREIINRFRRATFLNLKGCVDVNDAVLFALLGPQIANDNNNNNNSNLKGIILDLCKGWSGQSVGLFHGLEELSLNKCKQVDFVFLSSLVQRPNKLKKLSLDDTSISNEQLSLLNGIENISLADCSKINDVSTLVGVKELNLSGVNLSQTIPQTLISTLVSLNLSHCKMLGASLASFGTIRKLELISTSITDTELASFTNVIDLNLNWCLGITDAGIASLRSVRTLNVAFCKSLSTNAFLPPNLPLLEFLDVTGCTLVNVKDLKEKRSKATFA